MLVLRSEVSNLSAAPRSSTRRRGYFPIRPSRFPSPSPHHVVLELRPFRNSDPPHLARIWRSQPPQRGMLQPATATLLEHGVYSKMHFDPEGLIVAVVDNTPRGFVHAGFGPDEQGATIDTSLGTTHVLMIEQGQDPHLADRLLEASEIYLRRRGAQVIYAGGIQPLNSFYLGLYGGSEIPGVLQSDELFNALCQSHGYREIDRVRIFQCDLVTFRAPVSHDVRSIKRTTQLVETIDPPPDTWWDSCVWGALQRDRFELVDKYLSRRVATASFWDVQPLSSGWGMCTAGLFELYVEPDWRRRGVASCLLGETIRLLRRRGVATVEAQTMGSNQPAVDLYNKLGFTEVDQGIVYRKQPSE